MQSSQRRRRQDRRTSHRDGGQTCSAGCRVGYAHSLPQEVSASRNLITGFHSVNKHRHFFFDIGKVDVKVARQRQPARVGRGLHCIFKSHCTISREPRTTWLSALHATDSTGMTPMSINYPRDTSGDFFTTWYLQIRRLGRMRVSRCTIPTAPKCAAMHCGDGDSSTGLPGGNA